MAPILCAGVTTYKGLKETEARPGEWVAISGIGGLGHVAVQYAKGMGFKVVAIDVTPDKLALACATGADVAIDARSPNAVADVLKATGGGAAKRASVRTPSPGGKSPAAEKSSGARRKSAPARTSPGSRRSARA